MVNRRFQNQRKSIRLKDFDYSSPGAYFVTICTQIRGVDWFGSVAREGMTLNAAGEMIETELGNLETRFVNLEIDTYVIMPDHIHIIFILHPTTRRGELYVRPATQPDLLHPTIRKGELYVRPATQPATNTQIDTISVQNESTRGVRAVLGEHTVRPYSNPQGTMADSIGRMVQLFKTFTTQEFIRGVRQHHWQPFEKRFWERDYWERILRDDLELEQRRNYILNNLMRWLETRGKP